MTEFLRSLCCIGMGVAFTVLIVAAAAVIIDLVGWRISGALMLIAIWWALHGT